MRPKIGIIGFGILGRALAHGFVLHADIKIYDKHRNFYNSIEDTVNMSDFIFINVPTPMKENGRQDISIVQDAISNVNRIADDTKTIIIRSTVLPGTTRDFSEQYKYHDFIFCPEFLTARSSFLDFINATRIIIGGVDKVTKKVEDVFRVRFEHTPIYKTTWETAELVKYMANCFFSVKISFLNEMYDICQDLGISFEDVKKMWLADGRIGNSHTDVPGHDGLRGYGGMCFPKDMAALVNWARDNFLDLEVCEAAERVNEKLRPEKDWLQIEGVSSRYRKEEEDANEFGC
jgi:UDPglucose 6-dehydrogenase